MRDHALVAEGDMLGRLDPEPHRMALARPMQRSTRGATSRATKYPARNARRREGNRNRLNYIELQASASASFPGAA